MVVFNLHLRHTPNKKAVKMITSFKHFIYFLIGIKPRISAFKFGWSAIYQNQNIDILKQSLLKQYQIINGGGFLLTIPVTAISLLHPISKAVLLQNLRIFEFLEQKQSADINLIDILYFQHVLNDR